MLVIAVQSDIRKYDYASILPVIASLSGQLIDKFRKIRFGVYWISLDPARLVEYSKIISNLHFLISVHP